MIPIFHPALTSGWRSCDDRAFFDATALTMDKPNVLLLGGCGFIGRNVVHHLVKNGLVGYLRVVDKVPPQVAWLNPMHQESFQNSVVEFKSANLINSESCKNAFVPPENASWDYVINCAGETKCSQTDPVYKEGVFKLSVNCANQAALQKAKHYVEISSGQMYSSEKTPCKEDQNAEPWTYVAKWKLEAEKEFENIPDLKYTILRPGLVYGLGDKQGLTCRAMISAVYQRINETMKLLWNADLKLNTVHVEDLCRAIWFVCQRDDTIGQVYNVVDTANSTQGSLSNIMAELFNIKVDYYGNLVSSVLDLANAADEANDKHLLPWAEACSKDGIQNTPLSPHMDFELLLHKHLHLDGGKLKDLGFAYSIPKPTVDGVKQTVDYFVDMNVFPPSLSPSN